MQKTVESVIALLDLIGFQRIVTEYLLREEPSMKELPCVHGVCDFPPSGFTCNDCHLRAAHIYAEKELEDSKHHG